MSQGLGISCNICIFEIFCKVPRLQSSWPSYKSDSWRKYTCTNVLLVCERKLGELAQPGGMWGLPWGLLCGTSSRRNYVWCLVIVVIFMEFGQAGAKRCRGCLKMWSIGVGDASHKRETLFIGKVGSHNAILLYCEILSQVLLGKNCKRFYWILFPLCYC